MSIKIEHRATQTLRLDRRMLVRWIEDKTMLEATEAKSWQKSLDQVNEELDRRELQGEETR